LSSFNWMDFSKPAIAIPGFPPRLKPPSPGLKIAPDAVAFPANRAGARVSHAYAFEPLMRSLYLSCPAFDMSGIKLVTVLNNLRKLIQIAAGVTVAPFRIDLELMDDTLFMSRWASDLYSTSSKGYGRGFEQACCEYTTDLAMSTSYHRVIRYDLGGLSCLVQFEADAYSCDCHGSEQSYLRAATLTSSIGGRFQPLLATSERHEQSSEETDEDQTTVGTAATSALGIYRIGSIIPSTCLVEIKSKEKKNINSMDDTLAQLWLGQRTNLFTATHSRGHFQEGRMESMGDMVTSWRKRNQDGLQRFVRLLERIDECIRMQKSTNGHSRAAMVYRPGDKGGEIALFSRHDGERMLPNDLQAQIW
ncbi:hypothetical protein K469DRAFT_513287, partial [Zopfia rhizophila CBS 207.26]